jgi:hypothetical protein
LGKSEKISENAAQKISYEKSAALAVLKKNFSRVMRVRGKAAEKNPE